MFVFSFLINHLHIWLQLKWVYLIIIISTLGLRNNPQVTWVVMGIMASAYTSKTLKVLLNQRRPSSAYGIKADPGMPSSHAYTILYTVVYFAVACKYIFLNTCFFCDIAYCVKHIFNKNPFICCFCFQHKRLHRLLFLL